MEGRAENTNDTAILKKSRSLDLKSLYKSKWTENTAKTNLKRIGNSSGGGDEKRKLNKKRRCRKSLSLAANDDTYVALNNSHVEAALGKSMAVPSGSNRLRDLWD